MSRYALGLPILLATAFLAPAPRAQEPFALRKEDFPVTGKASPGTEVLDRAMKMLMTRHGIPGGALVVVKDGRLVFARGYGWADLTGEPARPDTLFGLASLSKPITALAILKLIEEGKLKLEDRWVDLLRHITPPRGARVDPRLKTITVLQLLNHSGGWNRGVSGDPINFSVPVSRHLGVPQPVTPNQLISFMMGLPLDFDPGAQSHYSNFGYIVLGQIVEKVSGQKYEDYVRKQILAPMGIRKAAVHNFQQYLPGEARRYLAGTGAMMPHMNLPMVKAAAGWSASPVDMARFLTALDGSRGKPFLQEKTRKLLFTPPPEPIKVAPNGTFPGVGFEIAYVDKTGYSYFQDGNWHGMRTFMKRLPNGVNWMLAFNANMQPDFHDRQMATAAVQELKATVERIRDYPKVDFFDDFR